MLARKDSEMKLVMVIDHATCDQIHYGRLDAGASGTETYVGLEREGPFVGVCDVPAQFRGQDPSGPAGVGIGGSAEHADIHSERQGVREAITSSDRQIIIPKDSSPT